MVMRGPNYEDPYENEEPEYRGGQPMPPYGSNQTPYGARALPDDEDEQPIKGRPVPSLNSSSNGPQFSRQASGPRNIDPLLGVPPEFRSKNAKTESKPAEKRIASKPTSAPLPKARPDETKADRGPAVAKRSKELETAGSVFPTEKKNAIDSKKANEKAAADFVD